MKEKTENIAHIFRSKIFFYHIFGSRSNVSHEHPCISFCMSPPPYNGIDSARGRYVLKQKTEPIEETSFLGSAGTS